MTLILYNSKKAKTIETIVNTELKRVSTWLILNKLSLNRDKTELIFFHSRRNTLNHDNISIKFEGKKLIPVDNCAYGFDEFFSYRHEAHTTNLELKSDQMSMLSVPNIRTVTYGNKSIKYHCARLWNSFLNKVVPTDANFDNNIILDNIGNIDLFKSKFKKHFLYLYTLD